MTPPFECTSRDHAIRKRRPEAYFIEPVCWPEAGKILWLCPVCKSSVATPMTRALDEHETPSREVAL